MIEICFVCTGATCRSVMAERIARKKASALGIKDISFSSAGLCASGQDISQNAAKALEMLGYDGSGGKATKLAERPNVVYVAVTAEHKKHIKSQKCISFEELFAKVDDPFGKDLESYVQTAKLIEKNVDILLEKIKLLRGEL